jgi:SAM-dependent methyltransferase
LVCVDPLPTAADLAELYAEDYFTDGLHGLDRLGSNYERWADRTARHASVLIEREIRRRHKSARTLYEIGAAMGHFLAAARAAGLVTSGIEFSATAVAKARRKFGVEIQCGDFETTPLSAKNGRWDIVYAGDVFEHFRNPARVVERMWHLATPGGLVVVRVPGTFNLLSTRLAEKLLRAAGREKQLPDPPYHLYEYTDATIRRMLGLHFSPVEVIHHATPPFRLNLKTGSVDYWAKLALQFVNYPLTAITRRFGDRMTVYARKPGRADRS